MSEKDDFVLQDFLPFLLNRAAEESSLEFQTQYKNRYGMLRTEWRVLFHLGIYGSLTAKEISERAKIHKTKISRAVAKLAERRFITRDRDENDRRAEHLSLTSAGETAYRDLRSVAKTYDAKLASRISKEEAVVLRQLLRKLSGIGE
ncbi:MarR family transcriptional regulator [Parasedimentitalea maritima]|uniref:MarR family transcriptional regulator n=1 Tax=Parasedimentitalea maritima TaxID=2578117 RepID=A0A5R8Z6P9_9RHOB|nr:MarR family transcriptional regulator [Zongyanglinia marina]KAE9629005.1 MarR family transcriptional regulator [Zongyanglinia marina]TLP61410.1 MarR family transcriptional regulator [Zongyanglinia marina]